MNSNILIVDDEPSVLKLLKDLLVAEGLCVRPFSSGSLALRSAQAETPTLILLDIRMPNMDGFAVCRQLKENPRLKDIPVIFISAATDIEDKIKAFQAGGVDYITKPFQREEVVARIKTHVALNESMRELKRTAEALQKSEARLKMAQAIAHLGHWEWDAQAERFYWSEETYRIFGFEPRNSPADYETFLQVVHPDDKDRVADGLKQLQTGNGFDMEYRIVLPGGEIRVVRAQGQVVSLNDRLKPKFYVTVKTLPIHEQITMLGVIEDITERKQLEWRLKQQANTDFLTGCASRRYFLEHAEREITRHRRYGGELSLLMLDLDHFKTINDQLGHHAGDLTLKTLVTVCRNLLREVDLIGRMGGEEFAILLPETNSQRALEVAERLCQAVASTDVPLPGQASIRFTTSIGVTELTEDTANLETLFNRADNALYKAKQEGRNRVCA